MHDSLINSAGSLQANTVYPANRGLAIYVIVTNGIRLQETIGEVLLGMSQ